MKSKNVNERDTIPLMVRQVCGKYEIDADTASEKEIKAFISNLTINDLCSIRNIGPVKAKRIMEWATGVAPVIPGSKRKTKTFRLFGKSIRITISIN